MWKRLLQFFRRLGRGEGRPTPSPVARSSTSSLPPQAGTPRPPPPGARGVDSYAAPVRPPPRPEREAADPARQVTPSSRALTGPRSRVTPVASEYVDLIIGLDFGTSSTKAAVRAPYFRGGGRVAMVQWFQTSGGLGRFLLPTRIHLDGAGRLSLDALPMSKVISDLKLRLIDEDAERRRARETLLRNTEAEALVAGYLALVLRRIRSWFKETQRDLHRSATPRWQVNLGIPSPGYDDIALRGRYDLLLRTAWWIAESPGEITIQVCAAALDQASLPGFHPGLPPDAYSVVPEVAAEVVGYAKSTRRSPGLHVLLDVGASTLDICAFALHERQGDDYYAFLTSDVQQLGAFRLHQARLSGLRSLHVGDGDIDSGLLRAGPLDRFPASIRDYLHPRIGLSADGSFDSIDAAFRELCRRATVQTVLAVYHRRDPHSSRWREKLPVFLAGGGSEHSCYQEALVAAEKVLVTNTQMNGFHVQHLPTPASLELSGLGKSDYRFLAVAVGLSHERIVIGEIQPPSHIKDVTRRVRSSSESAFVDKDQV